MNRPVSTRRARVRARLAALIDGRESFDVVEAGLLVASEEYPELDVQRESARVRALSRAAGLRSRGEQNPFARLDRGELSF